MARSRAAQFSPVAAHTLVVHGLTSAEVMELDALAFERAVELKEAGGRVSRNSYIVSVLKAAIARGRARRARLRRASGAARKG